MNSRDFSNSASELQTELRALVRDRNINRDDAKESIDLCNKAKAEVIDSGEHLALDAIGAGMSSRAITAIDAARTDIRSELFSAGINPAKESITETRNALRAM